MIAAAHLGNTGVRMLSCTSCYSLPDAERLPQQIRFGCPDIADAKREGERFECNADRDPPGTRGDHWFEHCAGYYVHRMRADGFRPVVNVARMYRSMVEAGIVAFDALPAALADAVLLITTEDDEARERERREDARKREQQQVVR